MQHKNNAGTSVASNFKAKRSLDGKIARLDVSPHIEATKLPPPTRDGNRSPFG